MSGSTHTIRSITSDLATLYCLLLTDSLRYYVPRSAVENATLMQRDIRPEGYHLCRYAVHGSEIGSVVIFQSGPLEGLVRFDFKSMDAWFEEDEQIYVHPKDPYKRIDIRRSSREIRIEIDGVVVAKTTNAALLFETMLRTRYYLPPTSVDQTLLTPSDTVTSCPYKGDAAYFNITVKGKEIKDALWWYQYPTTESIAIAGMWCFYNEKVDIFVDGMKEIQ